MAAKIDKVIDEKDTPAVLAYRVGKLEETTATGFRELKEELRNLQNHYVTSKEMRDAKEAADLKHQEQDNRLLKLESWNEWAVKIVGAAIILAVLSLVAVTKVG